MKMAQRKERKQGGASHCGLAIYIFKKYLKEKTRII
jgi:hypothetical protein